MALDAFVPLELCGRPRRSGPDVVWHVWAPRGQQVELVLHPNTDRVQTIPIERGEWGYWRATTQGNQSGDRYAYRLNAGGDPRPGPCAVFQPDGVHRPSALYFPE